MPWASTAIRASSGRSSCARPVTEAISKRHHKSAGRECTSEDIVACIDAGVKGRTTVEEVANGVSNVSRESRSAALFETRLREKPLRVNVLTS